MARILEALKSGEARRSTRLADTAALFSLQSDIKRMPTADEEEPLSYIEVGGANRAVEGSPDVLRQSLPAAPVPPAEPAVRFVPAAAVSEDSAAAVSYQPWPSAPTSPALAAELVVYHQPDQALSQQYRAILQQMLQGDAPPQTLLFTSLSAHTGVALALLNLAIAACLEQEMQVAVVDLNIYQPALASWLGLADSPGLQDVLAGRVALEQALRATAIPDLSVLPVAATPLTEMTWTTDAIRWIVGWLQRRFDLIFLHMPAWESPSPLEPLLSLADGIVPVLTPAENSSPAAQQLLQTLTRKGGHLQGILSTNLPPT